MTLLVVISMVFMVIITVIMVGSVRGEEERKGGMRVMGEDLNSRNMMSVAISVLRARGQPIAL